MGPTTSGAQPAPCSGPPGTSRFRVATGTVSPGPPAPRAADVRIPAHRDARRAGIRPLGSWASPTGIDATAETAIGAERRRMQARSWVYVLCGLPLVFGCGGAAKSPDSVSAASPGTFVTSESAVGTAREPAA